MLKILLFSVLIPILSKSWLLSQFCLFMLSLMWGLFMFNSTILSGLSLNLGVDSISFILILLSLWLSSVVISSSQGIKESKNFFSSFLVMISLLMTSLILTFSSTDYLLFYICFESSLIPTLMLIIGWGYQPERLQAGIYMLFYTLFASLPLLGSILLIYSETGSLIMNLSFHLNESWSIWYLCSVMAFVVKLPVFMFHLWLPKAHVEAPVAASMLLAGILLKLGGYGLLKILPLFEKSTLSFSWLWVSLGLAGAFIMSLVCLRQTDMKSLIAYSSVVHMGLVFSGLMVGSSWGVSGAVVVMVGHGLCSSGLFCMANMVYERVGSRSLLLNKGLLNFMPSMGLWWFLFSAGNMAAPPSINLLGEISLIISVAKWSSISMIMLGAVSFFSAAYSLYLFSISQHGVISSSVFSCCSGKVREYFLLILHWVPLNLLIVKGESLMFMV
uniref:NADH-ubiquinone oxidoreductase chain 4 n=1 Tax=Crangon hakodatei TaxID=1884866 RepID=A0A1C9CY32_9EUCA|nr:NADH dehydrogenase subunit 4 [Crangon hakodatei]